MPAKSLANLFKTAHELYAEMEGARWLTFLSLRHEKAHFLADLDKLEPNKYAKTFTDLKKEPQIASSTSLKCLVSILDECVQLNRKHSAQITAKVLPDFDAKIKELYVTLDARFAGLAKLDAFKASVSNLLEERTKKYQRSIRGSLSTFQPAPKQTPAPVAAPTAPTVSLK